MTKINVIYEDNHILLAEKPVNILSQSDRTEDEDMLTLLKEYLKEKYSKPGEAYLGLVHRLDRPAGGLMVFAKTSKAAARLSETIRKKELEKTYLIVVNGVPDNPSGRLLHYLKKDSVLNTVKAVKNPSDGYKKAELEYEVLETIKGYSLIKVNLLTGRSHQIRVQFSETGNPLFGDTKYGGRGERGRQLALWSTVLRFKHPVRDEISEHILKPHSVPPWNMFSMDNLF